MGYQSPTIVASGITWAQLKAGGPSAHLEALIAAQVPTATPTAAPTIATGTTVGGTYPAGTYYAVNTESSGLGETNAGPTSAQFTITAQAAPTGTPTVVVSGSGGTLTAGIYFGKFTYVDSNLNAAGVHGETLAGTEFTFTQVGTDEPVITINDGGLPAWASGRNLYLTAHGGASGTEVLAFTGITTTTYTILANPTASVVAPPAVNTTTTNIPVITYPALKSGNTWRNLYLGLPGGASTGPFYLYLDNQTGATSTILGTINSPGSGGSFVMVKPPGQNQTGLTFVDAAGVTNNEMLMLLRACKQGNFQWVYRYLHDSTTNFTQGSPVPFGSHMTKHRRVHAVFAILATMAQEEGVLFDTNPGTIGTAQQGIGYQVPQRTWP